MRLFSAWLFVLFFWSSFLHAAEIRQLNVAANDIIYDSLTQKIYASVPTGAGSNPDSILPIDPIAGTTGSAVAVGSNPNKLARSGDGQFLYVGLDGQAAVRRFDLASQTAGLLFSLGSHSFFGLLYPEDIAVLPGSPGSVAVSRRYLGVSPRHAGVAIYDDGVQRPNTTPTHTGSNVIEFSGSAARLYGYNNETTEFGLRRMSIDENGVSVQDTTTNLISGFGLDIAFEGGLLYSTSGVVVDPEARTVVGTFPGVSFANAVRPDSAAGRVYFFTGSFATSSLLIFDQSTFTLITTVIVPGVNGTPSNLIRWGDDGLAFRTSGGQVFLIRLLSGDFDPKTLTVTKSGSGSGTVTSSPAGVNCGTDCEELYAAGALVTLTANAADGSQFSGWGGACSGTGTCIVAMDTDLTVTAAFNVSGVSETLLAKPFFPIRTGNFWRYRVGGFNFTSTVLSGTTLINKVATMAIQDSPGGFTQYYTNDSGIQLHRLFDPSGFPATITFSPPVTIANAVTEIGQNVSGSGTVATEIGSFKFSASFTVEAFDNVTVPLRNFNVIRVVGTITIHGGGFVNYTFYLARNVGVVKFIESDGFSTAIYELTATNVKQKGDFDGDGISDVVVYNNGAWSIVRSSDGGITTVGWGGPGWTVVPGDYDGDGRTDVAAYNNGAWSIVRSSDGGITTVGWGGPDWVPVPGDYDGDGKTDIAVYNNGAWSIVRSSDGGITTVGWGGPGWVPMPADYDGDGKTDVAAYNNGAWSIKRSSDGGTTVVAWGGPGWVPVPADYDGDGKTDVAAYNNGAWSIKRSSDDGTTVVGWGGPGWVPVPRDYDGDGKTDIGVYNNGAWSIVRSGDSGNTVAGWGGPDWTSVPMSE